MPQKGRMSGEEKVRLVEAYLAGEMGSTEIISKYSIGKTTFKDWIRLYKTRGAQGLIH